MTSTATGLAALSPNHRLLGVALLLVIRPLMVGQGVMAGRLGTLKDGARPKARTAHIVTVDSPALAGMVSR